MKSQIYLYRLFSIVAMGSIYLPIVFFWIPFPFGSILVNLTLWIPLILVYNFRILFKNSVLYVLLYYVLMTFGINLFWESLINNKYLVDFWIIFLNANAFLGSILMYYYFIHSGDIKGLRLVVKITLLFCVVTSLVSLVGLSRFPGIVRISMGAGLQRNMPEIRSLGIGSYGFFNGLMVLSPIFAYMIKNKFFSTRIKIVIASIFFLFFFTMIQAEVTTTFLFAISFFVIGYFMKRFAIRYLIIASLSIYLFFFVFNTQIASLFYDASNYFDSKLLKTKMIDIGKTIQNRDFDPDSKSTYFASERLSRSSYSLDMFLANPLWGSGKNARHAYWLDQLATFGIIGFIPILLIFISQARFNRRILGGSYLSAYYLSLSAVFLFGLMKGGILGHEIIGSIFFLLPSMYFLTFDQNKIDTGKINKPIF